MTHWGEIVLELTHGYRGGAPNGGVRLDDHQVLLFDRDATPLLARALQIDGVSAPHWAPKPEPAPTHDWTGPPAPQPESKSIPARESRSRKSRRLAAPPVEEPQLPLDDPAAALGVSLSARRGRAV